MPFVKILLNFWREGQSRAYLDREGVKIIQQDQRQRGKTNGLYVKRKQGKNI